MWPLWPVALYIQVKIVCTIHNWKNVAVVCYIDVPYNAGFTVVQYNNLKKYHSIEVVTKSHTSIVD
jgi:hypothetical protein